MYDLSGREAEHTRELVTTPAVQVNDPAAFDVEVNRPGPGGSWVHLVVTLKPGATVLLPRASNHPVHPSQAAVRRMGRPGVEVAPPFEA